MYCHHIRRIQLRTRLKTKSMLGHWSRSNCGPDPLLRLSLTETGTTARKVLQRNKVGQHVMWEHACRQEPLARGHVLVPCACATPGACMPEACVFSTARTCTWHLSSPRQFRVVNCIARWWLSNGSMAMHTCAYEQQHSLDNSQHPEFCFFSPYRI